MVSSWGEPDYANTDAMQGPAQMTAIADFAMARGIRHFDTQADLIASSGALEDFYAFVKAIPGAHFRFDGVSTWVMHGIARFATASARNAAITSPATGMLSRIDTERFVRRYSGSAWLPYGAGMFPIIPTGVAGTGATIGSDGAVTVASGGLSVSINGCFPSDFKGVFAKIKSTHSGNLLLSARMRVSGVDAAGASDYTYEGFSKVGATLTGAAAVGSSFPLGGLTAADNRVKAYFDNPADAEATYLTATNSASNGSAHAGNMIEGRHILTTGYDGLTLFLASGTINALRAEFFGFNDN